MKLRNIFLHLMMVMSFIPAKAIDTTTMRMLTSEELSQMGCQVQLEHIRVLTDPKQGFAIVTKGSDAKILAYGPKAIDPNNVVPEFVWMISQYEIQNSESSKSLQKLRRRVATYTNVNPLIKSYWGQGYPFYNACPKDEATGYICKTGCVATATAQVLYYYKKPLNMRGFKTYAFKNSLGHYVVQNYNFANTEFSWSDMTETYTQPTASQSAAVAELMLACGVGSNMIYSAGTSLSDPSNIAATINDAFDGLSARIADFNEELVTNEIRAGRPVIYSGNNGNGSAHCFILDGMTSDGKIHCNMGYNGVSDGYYSLSGLGGYPNPQNLLLISTSTTDKPTCSPVSELANLYIRTDKSATSSIEPNRWYVLWNSGRGGSPYSKGVGEVISNMSILPNGEKSIYNAGQIVRFIPRSNGGYYIQTGRGDYFGSLSASMGCTGTITNSASAYFMVESISQGYFALKSNGVRYIDTNGIGKTVVGWDTTKPTDNYSNSSWQLFPVETSATPFPKEQGGGETITDNPFDGKRYYKLHNTGASGSTGGYLVAINSTDSNPTLRGVTNTGSTAADTYGHKNAVDIYNPGTYWTLESNNSRVYLKNVLTGQYLYSTGYGNNYTFRGRSNIAYGKRTDGSYWFNATNATDSYLCATYGQTNPAANGTLSHGGTYWMLEESTIPLQQVSASTFSNSKYYTIQNTADCQGYLVTLTANDTEPTLRGVDSHYQVMDDAYTQQVDLSSWGSYWKITSENGLFYVQNVLTGRYLTNEGNQTPYSLSPNKTPIKIGQSRNNKSYFWFNVSEEDNSFLCARWGTSIAAGFSDMNHSCAQWTVQEHTGKQTAILPTGITLSETTLILPSKSTHQLTATITPANASQKSVIWSSSDESIATVTSSGLVQTTEKSGSVRITATSVSAPSIQAHCVIAIKGSDQTTLLDERKNIQAGQAYLIRNQGNNQYLVATHSNSQNPELVSVTDLSDPYNYWTFTPGNVDGYYYIYNVGAKKYLTDGGTKGSSYVFTDKQTGCYVSASNVASALYVRCTSGNYLYGDPTKENPAIGATGSNSLKDAARWFLYAVEGINFTLRATTEEIRIAQQLLAKAGTGVGYPAATDPSVQKLQATLSETQVDFAEYLSSLDAYLSAPVLMPEVGKAYRISAVHAGSDGRTTDRYTLYTGDDGLVHADKLADFDQEYNHFYMLQNKEDEYSVLNDQNKYFCWFGGSKEGVAISPSGLTADSLSLHIVSATRQLGQGGAEVTTIQKFGRFQIWGYPASGTGERRFLVFNPLNAASPSRGFEDYDNDCKNYADGADTYLFEFVEDPDYVYSPFAGSGPGDVNADHQLNVADLTALVSYILGTPQSYYDRKAADINGDGTVNVTDYTLLVQMILKIGN